MMVTLTFPDGARREFPNGINGRDVAEAIAKSLAKKAVAVAVDGQVRDLADKIDKDACVEILNREDPQALELIRHDAAHVLAEAVQTLWPGTQVTIGPVIENGFYYDFFRNRPFTKEVWSREDAKRLFADKGEMFKVELVDAIPEDQPITIYKQGEWFDLCRGPHM